MTGTKKNQISGKNGIVPPSIQTYTGIMLLCYTDTDPT